jgi:uncharacterized repeat protein (TIGR02543 family)
VLAFLYPAGIVEARGAHNAGPESAFASDDFKFLTLDEYTLTVNVVGNGTVTKNPDQTTYHYNDVVQLTATPDAGWTFDGWSGDLTGTDNPKSITMDGNKSVTATFTQDEYTLTVNVVGDGTVIDVWHGPDQAFGQNGRPQPWVNILGNVSDSDGVDSLAYSLNGGPASILSVGPDGRRLASAGDFNIDIPCTDLVNGTNQVVITATDELYNRSTKMVTVTYSSGNVWPLPYSIDWSSATSIQDVAQVVDGLWTLEADSVRILEPGYDRLVAIGDVSWTDYEVMVPVTIHDLSDNMGGAGILLRWNGHTDDPISGWQPKTGWNPLGAIGWFRYNRLEFWGNDDEIIAWDYCLGLQYSTGCWSYLYFQDARADDTGRRRIVQPQGLGVWSV